MKKYFIPLLLSLLIYTSALAAEYTQNHGGGATGSGDITADPAWTAAGQLIISTGSGAAGVETISANVLSVLRSADNAAVIANLGLGALSTVTPGTGVAAALAKDPGTSGSMVLTSTSGIYSPTITELTNGDTTPNVETVANSKINNVIRSNNNGLITDFRDSAGTHNSFIDGRSEFWFLIDDAGTSIKFNANANIEGNSDTNFTGSATQITLLHFLFIDSRWQEVGMGIGMSDPVTFAPKAIDSGVPITDTSDATKRFLVDVSGNTTGKTTTFATADTADATHSVPPGTNTLVAEGTATGGLILGVSTPGAPGEVGFDGTDKYLFYGANSEDWYFRVGSASNTVMFGSNTGVTNLNVGAIKISSGIRDPVIGDPDSWSPATEDYYGGTFIANAAGTFALPAVSVGMNFSLVLEGANAVVVDPDGTGTADTIYMNGLAAAQDENITSSTSGAICTFQYRSADTWMATCNNFTEATPP